MPASPRDRLRALAARATAGAAARLGLDLVPKGAYSPLADVPEPSDPSWSRRMDLPGVRFDLAAQAAFVREALREHVAAFAVPPPFRLDNPLYGPGDAELLYALTRHAQPRRILELGSGWSTHVARAAPPKAELVAVDPEAQLALPPGVRHERAGAGELPLDRFTALEASDVLFVDTSHVVKRGSEVNRIVLGVLPRLQSGVLVHFHDVFLPYDYPRLFFELSGHFSEQYLLAALLTGNDEWEVVLAAQALWRDRPDASPRCGIPAPSARRASGSAARRPTRSKAAGRTQAGRCL